MVKKDKLKNNTMASLKFEQLIYSHVDEYIQMKSENAKSNHIYLFMKKMPEFTEMPAFPCFFQIPLNKTLIVLGRAEKAGYFIHYHIVFVNKNDYIKYNLHPKNFESSFISHKDFENRYIPKNRGGDFNVNDVIIPPAQIIVQNDTYFERVDKTILKDPIEFFSSLLSSVLTKNSLNTHFLTNSEIISKELLYWTLSVLPANLRSIVSFCAGAVPTKKTNLVIEIDHQAENKMISIVKNISPEIEKFAKDLYEASRSRSTMKMFHSDFDVLVENLKYLGISDLYEVVVHYSNDDLEKIFYEKALNYYTNGEYRNAFRIIERANKNFLNANNIKVLERKINQELQFEKYLRFCDIDGILNILDKVDTQNFLEKMSDVAERDEIVLSKIFEKLPKSTSKILQTIDNEKYSKLYKAYVDFSPIPVKDINNSNIEDLNDILTNLYDLQLERAMRIELVQYVIEKLNSLITTCNFKEEILKIETKPQNSIVYVVPKLIETILSFIDNEDDKKEKSKLTKDIKNILGKFINNLENGVNLIFSGKTSLNEYSTLLALFYNFNKTKRIQIVPKLAILCNKLNMKNECRSIRKTFKHIFNDYLDKIFY